MLDLVIKNGTVVDGTGAPRRAADIGIKDGRIAKIGTVTEPAKQTIDATGQIVAPGFIDVHTHYDAQAFWDGTLSPSCYHGVTTVIAGNCGFSIAPLSGKQPDAEYLLNMLARVEGMPVESLRQGVPWNWTSFGEYLSKLDGKLSINAGFMVGHSALRRTVMGERAVGSKATPQELEAMKALLGTSIAEGGLGLSSTVSVTHNDADGRPVPSRHATDEELYALAGVCKDHPGTTIEFLPAAGQFTDEDIERMTRLSLAAGRPLNWNLLAPNTQNPGVADRQLSASDHAAERGAKVVALAIAQPVTLRLNFTSMFLFDTLQGWEGICRMSLADRKQALRDPAVLAQLEADAPKGDGILPKLLSNWSTYRLFEIFNEKYKSFEGKSVGDFAQAQGKPAFQAMIDLVLADDLKTVLSPPTFGTDEGSWQARAAAWKDPRAIIGASDAGAHLDMIDTFAITTAVLGEGTRVRGLLTLEEAVQKLTQAQAQLIGIKERGELREGWHADIVVFDAQKIGHGPVHTRFDLPGGAGRLYAEAEGISHIVVNGVETIRDNRVLRTDTGRVLRSGRDTYTVNIPANGVQQAAQ